MKQKMLQQICNEMIPIISEQGNLTALAKQIRVHEKTLSKILHGQDLSYLTALKIKKWLKKSRKQVTFQNIESTLDAFELQKDCQKILASSLPLQVLAKQFGTQEFQIKKVAENRKIGQRALGKVVELIEHYKNGTLEINYDSENIKKLKHVYKLYCEHGTLQAVGNLLGVTRERIRQMLVKGTEQGFFRYQGREYPYIAKEQILAAYKASLNFQRAAKECGVSLPYLKKLLTAYGITQTELRAILHEGRKKSCINEYREISKSLGRNATTTDLQALKKGHNLHNKIIRLWGGIDNFREELEIEKPKKEHFGERMRPWRERKQRLALIVRMQHLDMIREALVEKSPQATSEIAVASDLPVPRTHQLLKMLLASGEISKLVEGSKTLYTIAQSCEE